MNLTGVWKEKMRQVKHKVGLIFSGRIENMKKRITLPVCLATLALCMITPTALAAGKTYDPVFVEKYTYGSFDELRIQKVYQLSPASPPRILSKMDGCTICCISPNRRKTLDIWPQTPTPIGCQRPTVT